MHNKVTESSGAAQAGAAVRALKQLLDSLGGRFVRLEESAVHLLGLLEIVDRGSMK